jgi:hypothetical protein
LCPSFMWMCTLASFQVQALCERFISFPHFQTPFLLQVSNIIITIMGFADVFSLCSSSFT